MQVALSMSLNDSHASISARASRICMRQRARGRYFLLAWLQTNARRFEFSNSPVRSSSFFPTLSWTREKDKNQDQEWTRQHWEASSVDPKCWGRRACSAFKRVFCLLPHAPFFVLISSKLFQFLHHRLFKRVMSITFSPFSETGQNVSTAPVLTPFGKGEAIPMAKPLKSPDEKENREARRTRVRRCVSS